VHAKVTELDLIFKCPQLMGKECRPFLGQYTSSDWIQLKLENLGLYFEAMDRSVKAMFRQSKWRTCKADKRLLFGACHKTNEESVSFRRRTEEDQTGGEEEEWEREEGLALMRHKSLPSIAIQRGGLV